MDIKAAEQLAEKLIAENGLNEDGWGFRWDQAKNRLGVCDYRNHIIGLSKPLALVNDEHEVRDTILHEIAHAIAGPFAKHGPQWKAVARRLGATPRAASTSSQGVAPKWVSECPTEGCAFTSARHRLSEKAKRSACPKCCRRYNRGKWSVDYQLVWRHANAVVFEPQAANGCG